MITTNSILPHEAENNTINPLLDKWGEALLMGAPKKYSRPKSDITRNFLLTLTYIYNDRKPVSEHVLASTPKPGDEKLLNKLDEVRYIFIEWWELRNRYQRVHNLFERSEASEKRELRHTMQILRRMVRIIDNVTEIVEASIYEAWGDESTTLHEICSKGILQEAAAAIKVCCDRVLDTLILDDRDRGPDHKYFKMSRHISTTNEEYWSDSSSSGSSSWPSSSSSSSDSNLSNFLPDDKDESGSENRQLNLLFRATPQETDEEVRERILREIDLEVFARSFQNELQNYALSSKYTPNSKYDPRIIAALKAIVETKGKAEWIDTEQIAEEGKFVEVFLEEILFHNEVLRGRGLDYPEQTYARIKEFLEEVERNSNLEFGSAIAKYETPAKLEEDGREGLSSGENVGNSVKN